MKKELTVTPLFICFLAVVGFSQATKPFDLAGDVPSGAFKIESSAGR